ITSLAVLALMVERGRPLSELRRVMRRLPQVLVNVTVAAKTEIESVPAVAAAIRRAEQTLGDRGRVLVRYSGTEPLLRVMVEGAKDDDAEPHGVHLEEPARCGEGAQEDRAASVDAHHDSLRREPAKELLLCDSVDGPRHRGEYHPEAAEHVFVGTRGHHVQL